MRIVVAGASGFVGRRLCPALEQAGHEVVAMTRHPDTYRGAGTPVRADVHDRASLDDALRGADAAYYLVHSLDDPDFRRRDAEAARTFAAAAGRAGLQRIVYLGGLGDDTDDLSPHLLSRREVEQLLASGGVPVTTLRAGIIVGHGGISWEMTRQLVEHLPAMVTPRWVRTRTQPIAVADVVRYLVGVLEAPVEGSRAFDIGGTEVLEYVEMLRRVAAIEGRTMVVVPVPLLTPRLSSRWLSLVTSVDVQTGRSLIDSMSNEVVVRDGSIRELVPFEPMDYDGAVLQALGERAKQARSERRPALARLTAALPHWLVEKVPRDHREPDAAFRRRRKVVAGVTAAGAALLGVSLSTRPASWQFYAATSGVAATWLAGGLASGPLHLGFMASRDDDELRRPVLVPVLLGIGAFGTFYGCALLAREIPVLDSAISSVLAYAHQGDTTLVLLTALANGAAEEVFFRGALYAAIGEHHPVALSTAAYTLATVTTRNPALVLAAAVMGTLFAAQRRASGGIQAPVLTHLTWSVLMLRYLPPLFRDQEFPPQR